MKLKCFEDSVIAIYRDRNLKILGHDSGICLHFLTMTKIPEKTKYIDLLHNKYGKDNYAQPEYIEIGPALIKSIEKKWESSYNKVLLDIFKQSKRWGKYFDESSAECVFKKGRPAYLRIDKDRHCYTLVLLLFSWFRYFNELRSYGYQLIKWSELNNSLPVEKKMSIDQLIMLSSMYYCPDNISNYLIRNRSNGAGHIAFSGILTIDFFRVYDQKPVKLEGSRGLLSLKNTLTGFFNIRYSGYKDNWISLNYVLKKYLKEPE